MTTTRNENSLQTAVRWGWNGLVTYSAFRMVFDLFHRKEPKALPPVYSVRCVKRLNARLLREGSLKFADYVAAYKEAKRLTKESQASLRALGYDPSSIDPIPMSVIESLPTTPFIRENNRQLEYSKEKARELLRGINFATKTQQQRINRMLSIIDKHEAIEDAKDEADERDGDLQEEKNFTDIYNYAVKHGHVDPRNTSLEACKRAYYRQAYPDALPENFGVVSAAIVAIGAVALYILTH